MYMYLQIPTVYINADYFDSKVNQVLPDVWNIKVEIYSRAMCNYRNR
jgi:hypothetical protein